MRTIRDFEDRIHTENTTGDIPGFLHLYAGQEAIATGVSSSRCLPSCLPTRSLFRAT